LLQHFDALLKLLNLFETALVFEKPYPGADKLVGYRPSGGLQLPIYDAAGEVLKKVVQVFGRLASLGLACI